MELVVFDLDGTLLNADSVISDFTRETLELLSTRQIAYTVATGRTLLGARDVLAGHPFELPQAYKNGVLLWDPDLQKFSDSTLLTLEESEAVIDSCLAEGITPFVYTLEDDHGSTLYHSPLQSAADDALIELFSTASQAEKKSLDELPADARITHVNSIGPQEQVEKVVERIKPLEAVIAFSGVAQEGKQWHWLDIHHAEASKGGAIEQLKQQLGVTRVICFGDSDNDLSMFAMADESYAPANANEEIKAAATAVIGHHDDDGVARFLRERFNL